MPNYEYECTKCAHRFELWQSVGEAAPECPECAGTVRKIFHPIRTIYKGSGFYITDSRSEKSSKSSKSGSEAKSEAAVSTPAAAPGSDSAPAAKSTES